jgi:integrase
MPSALTQTEDTGIGASRTRRLSMDELARVWAMTDHPAFFEWTDFFRLLILTGARRSPFQAMRWQD